MRAQDLADLLRRRGDLVDMDVGADTITTAAYTPAARVGEAVIYTGPCWSRWHPMDIERSGLGGSETAAVHLARELSNLGWVVTVYGDIDAAPGQPGTTCYEQVIYRHHSTFDPLEPCDLLISSRYPEIFERPNRAHYRMLWLHDTDAGERLTAEIADRVDAVLTLSRWHTEHVMGRYPFLRDAGKVRPIRNGIDLTRFEGEVGERQPRVLYTSSPDRGLDVLLELWPEIRHRACDATLEACYSPVYWRIAEQDPVVGSHAARIRELADQPGVTLLPSQGQSALARLMRESRVWVAPSFNTPSGQPFHETSCIGAMEAQAAGLHVVASNWGALGETVQVGALVDGPPMRARWKKAIVHEVVRGLTDPATRAYARSQGPKHAQHLGWAPVALMVSSMTARGAAG